MKNFMAMAMLAILATCGAPSYAKETKLFHYSCVPMEYNAKEWHKKKYNSSPLLLGISPRIGPIILFVNTVSREWAITNENENGQHCLILSGKLVELWWGT